MYSVTKRMEVAGSHSLDLPYESKCSNNHGHNWIVTVTVESVELNKDGMVVDFGFIKGVVMELDHKCLNNIKPVNGIEIGNPTAENLARFLAVKIQNDIDYAMATERFAFGNKDNNIPRVSKVTVQESEGNVACYTP